MRPLSWWENALGSALWFLYDTWPGRLLLMWGIALAVVGLCLLAGALLLACSLAVAFGSTWSFGMFWDPTVWRAWLAMTLFVGTLMPFTRDLHPKWRNGEED